MIRRVDRQLSSSDAAVRSALRRFALGSALALVVLVLASFVIGRYVAREAALDEAEFRTQAIADSLAAPLVTKDFRAGETKAVADLDRLMDNRMKDGSIAHIKIWAADGTILWSDETRLIGRRFTFDDDERRALSSTSPVGDFSDLERPENVAERRDGGTYIEVYAGTKAASGERILFETYMSSDRISARQYSIVKAMVGVSIGGLLLFGIVVLPLSLSLARRVDHARGDRERMTRHALLSSELERRRIAQDLHDGVIQDLAGAGYVLPGLADRVRSGQAEAADADALSRIQDLVTSNVGRLRSMMTEVYPPFLDDGGLLRAVEDLVTDSAGPLRAEVRIDPDMVLGEGASQLAYRIVREGLRNVVKHAEATTVQIEIRLENGWVRVTIADDGKGVPTQGGQVVIPEGHLGLTLLEDAVREAKGTVRLAPDRPTGSTLVATFLEDALGY